MILTSKIKDNIFTNPILVASGTYGYGHEVADIVNVELLGGIITKSVTLEPREGNDPPRIFETPSGMLNSIGLANLGVHKFCIEKIPYLNDLNTNIIINIAGSSIDDYIQTLELLESSNGKHIGYEINISCPNVKKGGMEFSVDPKTTENLTKKIRSKTDKLLIMKLSPNVTNISEIALACEIGGADAVSAINTVVGMGIDIVTKRPKVSTIFGGLSGPAIKPIAIASVYKIFKTVKIPIIGIGGISCFEDVIEFILAGASLVEIGTLNYTDPNRGVTIVDNLKKFCSDNKINNLLDLKGQINYYEK